MEKFQKSGNFCSVGFEWLCGSPSITDMRFRYEMTLAIMQVLISTEFYHSVPDLKEFLELYRKDSHETVKFQLVASIQNKKLTEELLTTHRRSHVFALSSSEEDEEAAAREINGDIQRSLDTHDGGRGWIRDKILHLDVEVNKFHSVNVGFSSALLPRCLRSCRSLICPYNEDDRCFLYCITIHDNPDMSNPRRVAKYDLVNYDTYGIFFPLDIRFRFLNEETNEPSMFWNLRKKGEKIRDWEKSFFSINRPGPNVRRESICS